jgi:hypothetical protein
MGNVGSYSPQKRKWEKQNGRSSDQERYAVRSTAEKLMLRSCNARPRRTKLKRKARRSRRAIAKNILANER